MNDCKLFKNNNICINCNHDNCLYCFECKAYNSLPSIYTSKEICECCKTEVTDNRCECWNVYNGLDKEDNDRLMELCYKNNICPPQNFIKLFGLESARLYSRALLYLGDKM